MKPTVTLLQKYIVKAESEVNKLKIVPRRANRYPFDILALATVSKAFALSKACVKLVAAGLPDEAFGLSRSLVECSVNLRYLTAEPEYREKRSRDFINYAKAHKNFWYHATLQLLAGRKKEPEIRRYGDHQGWTPDYRAIHRHWSGMGKFVWDVMNINHPLDGKVKPRVKKAAYAVDYSQLTMFVHCLIPAIDNYFCDDEKIFVICKSAGIHDTTPTTLVRVLAYLHFVLGYAFFGLNVDRPAKLDTLFQKTLKSYASMLRRKSVT